MKGRAPGFFRMVPGLLDSEEYREVYAIAHYREPVQYAPVDNLRRLARVKAAAELMTVRAIRDARESGATWDEIGQALGISRQGAQQLLKRAGMRP